MSPLAVAVVAVGGAAGALARWAVGLASDRWLGDAFPWGTGLVNVMGAALFGAIWALTARLEAAPEWRLGLLTGFLGAFTTFSTFMSDTHRLAAAERWSLVALNVGGQLALGWAGVAFGLWAGSWLSRA